MTEKKALFALGSFRFVASRTMFDSLSRSESFRWIEQDRIGGISSLHFTGRKPIELEIRGETYAARSSSGDPLEPLRVEARKGEPMLLVDSNGRSLGKWVVLAVGEELSSFQSDGAARKIAFNLSLKSVVDDVPNAAKSKAL